MRLPSTRTIPKPRLATPGSIPITTCIRKDSGKKLGCLHRRGGEGGVRSPSIRISRSAPYRGVAPDVGARPKGRAVDRLHFAAFGHIRMEGDRTPPTRRIEGTAQGSEALPSDDGARPAGFC